MPVVLFHLPTSATSNISSLSRHNLVVKPNLLFASTFTQFRVLSSRISLHPLVQKVIDGRNETSQILFENLYIHIINLFIWTFINSVSKISQGEHGLIDRSIWNETFINLLRTFTSISWEKNFQDSFIFLRTQIDKSF